MAIVSGLAAEVCGEGRITTWRWAAVGQPVSQSIRRQSTVRMTEEQSRVEAGVGLGSASLAASLIRRVPDDRLGGGGGAQVQCLGGP